MSQRKVLKTVFGRNTKDGAGVSLVRVLGNSTIEDFDPFLMLDAFHLSDPKDYVKGFPMHPHRGMETVTYIVKGLVGHEDSLGNKGVIGDGSCQWMTAGSGILHEEMPREAPEFIGLQLWINLPAKNKMTNPKYNDLQEKDIPVIHANGSETRIVAGDYNGNKGPMQGEYVKINFFDLRLKADASWSWELPEDETLFSYVFSGGFLVPSSEDLVEDKRAVLFSAGKKLNIKAGPEGVHMVIVSGRPLKEPVVWGGPIVMNTEEELRNAFLELENNTFIKHNAFEK